MIKPVGPNILIKIPKIKSSIELLPGSHIKAGNEVKAVVEQVGTVNNLGIAVGHEVMFRAGTQPVVIEETEDYDLLIVPDVSILYIKNYYNGR